MDNAILEVRGLVKTFGAGESAVRAVDGVDFSLARGAFEAIMGPSGSGKSTFLHIVAGLLAPDAGTVTVGGTEITGLADRELTIFRRRRIGVVFQDFNLIPTLTARENIELPLMLDGTERKFSKRVDELVGMLGLGGRAGHLPLQLSGGERQRVAIARALACDPAVVLADEPTGNLDSPAAGAFCETLRRLNAELGTSILIVSHDPAVAAAAGRVHVLKDGRFAASFEAGGGAAGVSQRYLEAMK